MKISFALFDLRTRVCVCVYMIYTSATQRGGLRTGANPHDINGLTKLELYKLVFYVARHFL